MPLSGNGMFVIMTMGRTKPGREAEVGMQRQKEKRTVPVGACKDLIQGITKVVQSPTGTVKRPKSRSEISLFCTNSGNTPAAEEEQGVGNKEGQVIPGLDDGSEGIHAVAHIGVATDYIDGGEGGRISIPKHDREP